MLTELEVAQRLAEIQKHHKFCAFCGRAMRVIKTKDFIFSRLTGKKQLRSAVVSWTCTDRSDDVFTDALHDNTYLGCIKYLSE